MQKPTRTPALRRLVLFLAVGLVAGLGLTPPTFAQPSPEQMKERMAARTDTLIKQLNLTTAQEEPVRTILEARNTKAMELMASARESGSFMGMREDMDKLDEETAMKLGDVLTEEQMTTYKKIQEEQRNQRGRRRGGM
jgi:hypothetical protein